MRADEDSERASAELVVFEAPVAENVLRHIKLARRTADRRFQLGPASAISRSLWPCRSSARRRRSTSCRRAGIRRTAFSGGHTAVSAVWGLLGLTLLYIGLRTKRSALRLGGLALLGISLAKLFVYDLSLLSSITRALSFLAVGAVLLLGGFFTSGSGPRGDDRKPASA